MRIGFITQLLWDRYGSFWRRLFDEAGSEVAFAEPEAAADLLEDQRIASVSGLSFQLAVAQALALQECDLLVAPSLNAGSESRRGGGQDPWVSDFPGALGTVRGLPPILGVPAWLAAEQQSLVVETLQQITRDPGRVRRVWDRHRSALKHEPLGEPSWQTAAGRKTVGVVGQPWILDPELVGQVTPEGTRAIGQQQLDPFKLREEGSRVDPLMVPTDQEVLGAVRLFSRRGSINSLHLIVDETSGSDLWLRERVLKQASKPVTVHRLADLLVGGAPQLLVDTKTS